MRRDPGLLRVPQNLAKQTGLDDCLPGGFRRPERDEQRRLYRQLPAPLVRLPVRMMWEPASQGGGRLRGERYNPTLAPGHLELHGHLAVGTPDHVLEFQGAHLARTQADVTQQPQDGPVADTDRSRQVGLK
jgi:hypothetical protein